MDEQMNQNQTQSAPEAPKADSADVEKNKAMAIIGYILPVLFFIPMLSEEGKKSPFAMFHANQQLVLLLAAVVVNIAGTIIPIIGWFLILPFGSLFLLVLAIMGIINASKGEMKPLLAIGGFQILK